MTILYSKRVLPTNQDDKENDYMRIPGTIVNNTLDIEGNYTAPSLNSPRPSTTPDNQNHEIRLTIDNPTQPFVINNNPSTHSIYFLPSTCFSFHNVVNNKFTIVEPSPTTIATILEGDDSNNTEIHQSTITELNVNYPVVLEQDGMLASVYNFCFNNTYTDALGYNHYGFIIGPYINNALTDEQMFPTLYGAGITLNNISSTREFQIGYDGNLFTNVSLLLHGKLKNYGSHVSPTIPSNYFEGVPNIYTDLYWVGVTFFFTNYENKICSTGNASSIHVRSTVGSPFENQYKPYFAKKTKVIESVPIQYKAVERTQFGVSRGCPISTNTPLYNTDIYGNQYIGNGTMTKTVPNTDRDLLKISESVSLTDVIDEHTHVFLVLLPC